MALGANPETTKRMNNLKFDITPPEIDFGFEKWGRVFLAASTHSGEDLIVYNAYKKLKDMFISFGYLVLTASSFPKYSVVVEEIITSTIVIRMQIEARPSPLRFIRKAKEDTLTKWFLR